MSSSSDPADIISMFVNLRIDYCSGYSAAVLVFYDFVLTFGREVKLFWASRVTGASLVFFATRYVTLVYQILGVVRASLSNPSPTSCNVLVNLSNALDWIHYLPMAGFSAMRAYAMTQNRFLALIVFTLSSAPVGLNFASYAYKTSGLPGAIEGCVSVTQMPQTDVISFTVASRGSLILSDIMLIVVTAHATGIRSYGANVPWDRESLATVILQHGIIYFVVLTILNILHLSFTLASIFESSITSNITLFTDPITTILTYRFLLDLQETAQRYVKLEPDHPLYLTASDGTPSFVRAPA